MLFWETRASDSVNAITKALFKASKNILGHLGPWDKPRRSQPKMGDARITFLVSDGLYFGEGEMDALFDDPMARPALDEATKLMVYLTQRSVDKH